MEGEKQILPIILFSDDFGNVTCTSGFDLGFQNILDVRYKIIYVKCYVRRFHVEIFILKI